VTAGRRDAARPDIGGRMLAGVASIRDRDRSSQATDSALWGSSEVRVLLGLARRWPNEGQGLPRVEVLTLSSRKTYACSALPSRTLIVHVLPSRYRPMDTCQGSPCVSRRVNARRSRSRRKLLSPKRVSGTSTGHFLGLNPVFVRTNAAQNPGRPTYSFALSRVKYWVVSPTVHVRTR